MIRLIMILIGLSLLVACDAEQTNQDAPQSKRDVVEKEAASSMFLEQMIVPYKEDAASFQSFVDWFDSDTILFLSQQNQVNSIYKYDLFTGKKSLFYRAKQPIIQVDSNQSHTYFAVQTMHNNQEKSLIVLDSEGEEAFSWRGFAESIQPMWNPYERDKLLLSMVYKDWAFSVYEANISTDNLTEISVENPFVQWINSQTLGYLNWNQHEPDFSAPLALIDLPTGQETIALEDVYAAFSFPGTLLAISAEAPKQQYVDFNFYNSTNLDMKATLKVPVLQTFSEQMWIPNHVFDDEDEVFYYMKPTHPGDIGSYDGNYEFTAFSLETNHEKRLHVFERNVPLKLSPEGTWCLVGNHFEEIIHLKTGKVFALLM